MLREFGAHESSPLITSPSCLLARSELLGRVGTGCGRYSETSCGTDFKVCDFGCDVFMDEKVGRYERMIVKVLDLRIR